MVAAPADEGGHGDALYASSTAASRALAEEYRDLLMDACFFDDGDESLKDAVETRAVDALASCVKIAPLAVHAECSAWRAAGYFINAGLRHLPVVDSHNRVVGVLTRRDLVPGFASANDASSDARAERDESRAVAAERPFSP